MCVWKELIKETMQDKFNATAVLRRAADRIYDRLEAYSRKKINEKLTLEAKGKNADPQSIHRKLEGITMIDEEGGVIMDPLVKRWIDFYKSTKVNKSA
jgi:Na+/phosphate symporter